MLATARLEQHRFKLLLLMRNYDAAFEIARTMFLRLRDIRHGADPRGLEGDVVAVGKLQHDLDQLRYIHVPNQLNPSTLRKLWSLCSSPVRIAPPYCPRFFVWRLQWP